MWTQLNINLSELKSPFYYKYYIQLTKKVQLFHFKYMRVPPAALQFFEIICNKNKTPDKELTALNVNDWITHSDK